MRHPRSRAWARSAISAAALTLAVAGLSQNAAAQQTFDRLIVFGDSYADLSLSNQPASNPLAPPGFKASFWNVYPLSLQAHLGIPNILDVAVGGATASPLIGPPGIPPFLNLPQQVTAFLGTNPPFGPHDLITLNIGGNDIRDIVRQTNASSFSAGYPSELLTKDNFQKFADQTVKYAMGDPTIGVKGVTDLIKAGAHNFVLGEFSTISGLPELQPIFNSNPDLKDAADKYARAYFDGMQTALLPYAQAGNRFFLFDLGRLGQAVNADPAKYGFSGGFMCPPNGLPSPFSAVCGATPSNPTNNNPLQGQYYFGPDGLHLTNAGFDLVGRYMTNIVQAPSTIAVQPGIVMTTTGGFAQSLLTRLAGTHEARAVADLGPAAAADAPMGLGATDRARAPQAGSAGRFTSFAMGTFLGGNRSESADAVGYDYDATSGTAGIEYSISRNLIMGVALNYTNLSADLRTGANVDLDAIQGSAYLSYATRQMFADALVAYGSHDINLNRPGAVDFLPIHSSTDASALALAARAGYLFDLGSLRAGPVAGLTYIHSRVGGYTETGDDLATFQVSSQTLDSVTGNMGLRFLAPFKTSGGSLVVPHLDILLEHQFGDHTQTLTTTLVQAPLLPIPTTLPAFNDRTYGRIEGGVTFQLGADLSASVNAGTTFARDDGQDYRVSAGLNYRF